MSIFGDAALAYAGRGMAVFPLEAKTKEPHGRLAPHGYLDATTDIERVRSWWSASPDANIGLPCAPNKLLVLDEDPRYGGDQALEDLFMRAPKYGFETRTSLTGGGGRHFLFQHPLFDVALKDIAPGLDIKSKGYIAVPPSIHPNGKPYAWQDPSAPITEVPDWLLQIITQKIQRRESSPKMPPTTGAISEGQRNTMLFRIACSLRGKGLSEAAIRAALIEENRARCSPSLPDDEVRKIAASAGHYDPGPSNPRMIGVNPASVQTSEDALVLLNALNIWQGRLRWVGARRCGDTVICQTSDGGEVRFEAQHIMSFARCKTAIWSGTGIVIPTPSRKDITTLWEQAVELIGKASMKDYQARGGSEDDTRLDLLRTFRGAGEPKPQDRDALFALLCAIQSYRREPYAELAPPAVFLWEAAAWVHPGTLKTWLGTVTGGASRISVSDIREHLALLGFKPEALEKEKGDQRVKVFTWRGPAEVLDSE